MSPCNPGIAKHGASAAQRSTRARATVWTRTGVQTGRGGKEETMAQEWLEAGTPTSAKQGGGGKAGDRVGNLLQSRGTPQIPTGGGGHKVLGYLPADRRYWRADSLPSAAWRVGRGQSEHQKALGGETASGDRGDPNAGSVGSGTQREGSGARR
eukprot:4016845-Alexandrium_andersonii.AAC.1